MKHWMPRILLCFLGGTVTTVALALILALSKPCIPSPAGKWTGTGKGSFFFTDQGGKNIWLCAPFELTGCSYFIYTKVKQDRPLDGNRRVESIDMVPNWSLLKHYTTASSQMILIHEGTYGWPKRALGYQAINTGKDGRSLGERVFSNVLQLPRSMTKNSEQVYLPTRIIWYGFVTDSLLYGAVLWMFFVAPYSLRKWLRTKRGRCIKCGYDLRADFESGCSECGWNRGE